MTLLQPNPPWHHTILDQKLIDRILDAIPKVLVQKQIAALCGIHHQRLSAWLKYGERDIEENRKNSIYSYFYYLYHEKRAEVLHEKLKQLSRCPKNYGAITWLLERGFKSDFQIKSEAQEQLEHYVFNVIQPLIGQGGPNVGNQTKEVYSESDQTPRCLTSGIECTDREENTSI